MTTVRHVALALFLALLATRVAMAEDTLQIFHVPEDKIEFQLYPEPALVFVGINSSRQPIEGNFSFEIVNVVEKNKVHGVLQLGRIFRNRFNLSMMSSAHSAPGSQFPVRVRVDDPDTGKPIANVPVEIEFELSDCDKESEEITNKQDLTTDTSGYVVHERPCRSL